VRTRLPRSRPLKGGTPPPLGPPAPTESVSSICEKEGCSAEGPESFEVLVRNQPSRFYLDGDVVTNEEVDLHPGSAME